MEDLVYQDGNFGPINLLFIDLLLLLMIFTLSPSPGLKFGPARSPVRVRVMIRLGLVLAYNCQGLGSLV